MYIPIWIIIIALIAYYFWSKSKQDVRQANTVENLEEIAWRYKERLMEFAHFDSPRIIDLQDRFTIMENNYFRLKQRYLHNEEKQLEISRDWVKYIEALGDLKHARVLLDVDMSDNAFDNLIENSKEPNIIAEEVEKKFKSLLGKDFQKLLPDYDERKKKAGVEDKLFMGLEEDWKLYQDSPNYHRMIEFRAKEEKEKESTDKVKK